MDRAPQIVQDNENVCGVTGFEHLVTRVRQTTDRDDPDQKVILDDKNEFLLDPHR